MKAVSVLCDLKSLMYGFAIPSWSHGVTPGFIIAQ